MSLIVTVERISAGAEIRRKYTCAGGQSVPGARLDGRTLRHEELRLDPRQSGCPWRRLGTNGFGDAVWGGPCPPQRHGPHRYFFRLFALDTADLGLAAGARRPELDRVLNRHVLARAESMGRFERK